MPDFFWLGCCRTTVGYHVKEFGFYDENGKRERAWNFRYNDESLQQFLKNDNYITAAEGGNFLFKKLVVDIDRDHYYLFEVA